MANRLAPQNLPGLDPTTPARSLSQLAPMLLAERAVPPRDQSRILAEPKHDGYRVIAEFGDGQCRLRTRNGAECSKWFAEATSSLARLECGRTVFDGEMCILDDIGRSDFDALHARARRRRYTTGDNAVTFCVFDMLVHEGAEIVDEPLWRRKMLLASLLSTPPEHVLYVQHIDANDVDEPVSWLYARALELQLEGVVGKRMDSIYRPGERSDDWFKLKRPGAVPPGRFGRKA